ncbi:MULTISPECIES: ABC transporter permease [Bacillota]|jgi:putative ABC transport system permease protein|uniref:ABC transporter permease n=2 Tax=Bacillota TaxID=1239 RepID=UPI001FD8D04E|nr:MULTISPECIES: ABC transporter permease [Bacillota]
MRLIELIKTSWHALFSNPRRSILTMLGIIIGISSVITILSLGDGLKVATLKNLQTTKTGKQISTINYFPNNINDSSQGFVESDIDIIKSSEISGISNIKIKKSDENMQLEGQIGNSLSSLTVTLISKKPKVKLVEGKFINSQDNLVSNNVALISNKLAIKEFNSISNAINESVIIGTTSYTVTGVFNKQNDSPFNVDVILPFSTYYGNSPSIQGNTLNITFDHGEDVSKKSKQIEKLLQKNGSHKDSGTYNYVDLGSILSGIKTVIDALTYFISAIAGISLFIAGIGVMNMMYISVSERTQEIGIRLSIGAKPKQILLQFLFEAMFLTLLGGIIGFALGAIISMSISVLLPFKAIVTLKSFVLAFSVSTLVGITFGILPAKQAASKNLIDILK